MSRAKSHSSFCVEKNDPLTPHHGAFDWFLSFSVTDRFCFVTCATFPSSCHFGRHGFDPPFLPLLCGMLWSLPFLQASSPAALLWGWWGEGASLESKAKGDSATLEDKILRFVFSWRVLSGTIGHPTINSKCQLILKQFLCNLEQQSIWKCWGQHPSQETKWVWSLLCGFDAKWCSMAWIKRTKLSFPQYPRGRTVCHHSPLAESVWSNPSHACGCTNSQIFREAVDDAWAVLGALDNVLVSR